MGFVNQVSRSELILYQLVKAIPKKIRNNIIKSANEKRLNKINELETPLNLIFYITKQCNARCKHCFYWKELNTKNKGLTLHQIERIVYSLKHPLELLVITGGEPFLRKDIDEICSLFFQKNKTKRINIPTNGLSTDIIVKKAELIMQNNPKKRLTLQVSIDGLEKTHDDVRSVNNAFERAITTIQELKKVQQRYPSFTVSVATTITNKNCGEIGELMEVINKLNVLHKFNLIRGQQNVYGLDKKYINNFDPKDKGYGLPGIKKLDRLNEMIKKKAQKTIMNQIEYLKFKYSLDMLKNKKMAVKCLAGKIDGVIFPDGDVSLCEILKPFGNLKETDYDFKKIWNSKKADIDREKIKNCFCLQPCNLLNAMKYDTKTLMSL